MIVDLKYDVDGLYEKGNQIVDNNELIIQMVFGVVGGLGIFLLGMKYMSEGMQAVAGNGLRRMIGAVTGNRFMACGVGTGVTMVVQSSSITTVMVVGFVSAGLMTLTQAIGVIMGANIGTTITGWILVLKIGKYGLPILGVAALAYLFVKKERLRFLCMAIMGIGMIFFGLATMSSGLKPMRSMPMFLEWFSRFTADNYFGVWKCVLVGCLLTCLVQSSSATLGITIGLATTGMIDFRSAAALVLGENIGTTITAFLASIGRPTNAKRAAYSHIIFNVLGVLWITSIFPFYIDLIESVLGTDPGKMVLDSNGEETFPKIELGIATVHSVFNIANTLLFLPLLPLLAKVVTRLVPDKTTRETHHLTYLDVRLVDSGAMGIQESHDEIVKMGSHVQKMMIWLEEILASDKIDEEKVKKVFHREEILDAVQKEVTEFVCHILSGNVATEVVEEGQMQLRMADEYESISDYIATILKLHIKKQKAGLEFCDDENDEIARLHSRVQAYVELVNEDARANRAEVLTKARVHGDAITHDIKEVRRNHLLRMESRHVTPLGSLIFSDILNAYRRIKDHGLNIAEAIAGEK